MSRYNRHKSPKLSDIRNKNKLEEITTKTPCAFSHYIANLSLSSLIEIIMYLLL